MSLVTAAVVLALGRAQVTTKIEFGARPFALGEVRLLDSPFRHAQELDRKYLHSLEPDRLLHNFRVNAGLPSSAKPYGGWEAPDCELRGHFVGHYLSACAQMSAATGDQVLLDRGRAMVRELYKIQTALGGGYLSAFPESFIERVENQKPVWAPWYTLHKILAGLIDMGTIGRDKVAIGTAGRFADWVKARTDRLSDDQMQRMLGNEHGGMNEALANFAAVTGQHKYLALAERFNHRAVLDPLAQGRDPLDGLHANTQIPKAIGAAREYDLTGRSDFKMMATSFYNFVAKERSYVIGGHSDGEMFSPKARLSEYLGPNTTETCNTYNMIKLANHLFSWRPSGELADFVERGLINHILASQNPRTGMMCYYVPLRIGSHKEYNGPEDSFWCCTGTGVENHARYGESIYFQSDRKLYVCQFIASELSWKAMNVTVRQETNFPDRPSTRLRITAKKPTRFALSIRRPFWVGSGFGVKVNGKATRANSEAAGFVSIDRVWRNGDVVEVALPMSLRTEAFRDNPNRFAFVFGPVVLSSQLAGGQDAPVVIGKPSAAMATLKPTVKPGGFAAASSLFRNMEGTTKISLSPFFRMSEGAYAVYWDAIDEDQWQARKAEHDREVARLKDLDARTVDQVRIADVASERDHNLQQEGSFAGPLGGKHWRDARDGGWFSYELKPAGDGPFDLVVTYWGSDVGREFDVLLDGKVLARQKLAANVPNQFFDVAYPVTGDALRDKKTITVRFQAPARGMAGGVFGCRLVRHLDP